MHKERVFFNGNFHEHWHHDGCWFVLSNLANVYDALFLSIRMNFPFGYIKSCAIFSEWKPSERRPYKLCNENQREYLTLDQGTILHSIWFDEKMNWTSIPARFWFVQFFLFCWFIPTLTRDILILCRKIWTDCIHASNDGLPQKWQRRWSLFSMHLKQKSWNECGKNSGLYDVCAFFSLISIVRNVCVWRNKRYWLLLYTWLSLVGITVPSTSNTLYISHSSDFQRERKKNHTSTWL